MVFHFKDLFTFVPDLLRILKQQKKATKAYCRHTAFPGNGVRNYNLEENVALKMCVRALVAYYYDFSSSNLCVLQRPTLLFWGFFNVVLLKGVTISSIPTLFGPGTIIPVVSQKGLSD